MPGKALVAAPRTGSSAVRSVFIHQVNCRADRIIIVEQHPHFGAVHLLPAQQLLHQIVELRHRHQLVDPDFVHSADHRPDILQILRDKLDLILLIAVLHQVHTGKAHDDKAAAALQRLLALRLQIRGRPAAEIMVEGDDRLCVDI